MKPFEILIDAEGHARCPVEIVLPIDNAQWLHVFKTVDIGDVLHGMVLDIQNWEDITEKQLNDLDHSKRLTTLPSIYNVMAMLARPNV